MNNAQFLETPLDDEPANRRSSRVPTHWAAVRFADLAAGLGSEVPADPHLAKAAFTVRPVKPGETLYRAGDSFDAIYIVRAGFFKTVRSNGAGAEQVLCFPMAGDVIGLDIADLDRYTTDAIALDMSCVVVLPIERLAHLASEHPSVERLLHNLCSRESKHKQRMIWLLATLDAEARVATFLLHLSDRFGQLGYSRMSFLLRMTRPDMASHLGLSRETVSRIFSAFAAAGLLDVDRSSITLRDIDALHRVADSTREVARGNRPVLSPPGLVDRWSGAISHVPLSWAPA